MTFDLFKPEDFQGLRFNINRYPKDANLLEKEPRLKLMPSFASVVNRPDRDKLIRYVILMYDKGSPFIQAFTDIGKRKKEVATYAGYNNPLEQQGLYDFTDKDILPMVVDLCREINDWYWRLIVLNEQVLYQHERELMSPISTVDSNNDTILNDKDKITAQVSKNKLLLECDEIVQRLESYYKKVFSDNEINERVRKNTISPEAFAAKR